MLTKQKHYKPPENGAVLINITINKQYINWIHSPNEMTETCYVKAGKWINEKLHSITLCILVKYLFLGNLSHSDNISFADLQLLYM